MPVKILDYTEFHNIVGFVEQLPALLTEVEQE